jgi:7,8-dihydroneopterin aldolase/epimerase/oxygenase
VSTGGPSGGEGSEPEQPAGGDRILVRGLRVQATHGVLPAEQERSQPFSIDLELRVDLAASAQSDRLEDTVDYGRVAECAVAVVSAGPPRQLIESLAGRVAAAVLDVDPRIEDVTVTLRKLQPPLPLDLDDVGVRVTRHR